jgi:hypothetical protein
MHIVTVVVSSSMHAPLKIKVEDLTVGLGQFGGASKTWTVRAGVAA